MPKTYPELLKEARTEIPELNSAQTAALRDAQPIVLVDVREQSEWDAGHLEGSVHMPWHDIAGLPEGLDPARPIAVVCGTGQRAAVAASLVARTEAKRVIHVVDGGVPKLLRQASSNGAR